MLLTIDVGNTNTVLGIFQGDELIRSWRVKTDPRTTADELWLQYHALVAGYEVTGLSICSTVPATLRELRTMIATYFSNVPTTIVEPGIKTGVPLLVDNPKEIGADRIVNTLAAHTLYGGPAIVVDFGTSTNLDVVSPKGEFLGGALAAGIEISVEALAARAAQAADCLAGSCHRSAPQPPYPCGQVRRRGVSGHIREKLHAQARKRQS